jgi:hypothetical protein
MILKSMARSMQQHPLPCARDLQGTCRPRPGATDWLAAPTAGVRRAKMVALAEQYLKAVQGAAQAVLEALSPGALLRPSSAPPAPKRPAAAAAAVAAARRAAAAAAAMYEEEAEPGTIQQSGVLPPSILANREPYRHGEWRRQPFVPRWGGGHPRRLCCSS